MVTSRDMSTALYKKMKAQENAARHERLLLATQCCKLDLERTRIFSPLVSTEPWTLIISCPFFFPLFWKMSHDLMPGMCRCSLGNCKNFDVFFVFLFFILKTYMSVIISFYSSNLATEFISH